MGPFEMSILLATVLLAAFIQSTTGFGFAIVCMAILPVFIPYGSAQLVAVIMSLVGNLIIVLRKRAHIQWKQVLLPAIFGALGTVSGLLIIKNSAPELYKRLLGVFLCLLAIWFLFFNDRVRIKDSARNGALIGAVSGVCGGVFSINGPPMVIYYLSVFRDMDMYRATIQTYFLLMNAVNISCRLLFDLVPAGSVTALALAAPMVVLGNLAGVRLADRIDPKKMKTCIYLFLALSGLYTAITG